MRATLTFILLTALRDRLFAALAVLLIAAAALSLFLGEAALVEKRAAAVAFAGASARLILVLGLLVFVTFHVQRLFESRELEALLARPISRERVVLALWAGFATLAVLLTLAVGGALALLAPSVPGAAAFTLSLGLEGLLVCALALFAALTLERAVVSVLAAAGIYVMGRLAGFFVAIAASRAGSDGPMRWALEAIAAVMPRLDLFSQTAWLVHGPAAGSGWSVMLLQGAIYLPLLLAAAMLDLRRKRL